MFPATTKILIVDDMSTMRKFIRNCLAGVGLTNCFEAHDGNSAWAQLEAAAALNMPFELLVTDWNMPNMKGIDLLKKVRANPKMTRMPVMFVTAETTMAQVKEAIEAGATHYIVKPFSPDVFQEKLGKVYAFYAAQKK
jgi:two-component system chemotaxis response regulator CheY